MVGVAGSDVGEGCGVCVDGRVEVMMTSGVGVGVSGTLTSALQAVLTSKTRIKMKRVCEDFRFTDVLYPRMNRNRGEYKKPPFGDLQVPPGRLELPLSAPEADALSAELRGRRRTTGTPLQYCFSNSPLGIVTSLYRTGKGS